MNAITFNSKEKQLQGRVQAIWKLWFQKVKLSNLHKIGIRIILQGTPCISLNIRGSNILIN